MYTYIYNIIWCFSTWPRFISLNSIEIKLVNQMLKNRPEPQLLLIWAPTMNHSMCRYHAASHMIFCYWNNMLPVQYWVMSVCSVFYALYIIRFSIIRATLASVDINVKVNSYFYKSWFQGITVQVIFLEYSSVICIRWWILNSYIISKKSIYNSSLICKWDSDDQCCSPTPIKICNFCMMMYNHDVPAHHGLSCKSRQARKVLIYLLDAFSEWDLQYISICRCKVRVF